MSIEKVMSVIEDALNAYAQEVRDEALQAVEDGLRIAVGGKPKGKLGRPAKVKAATGKKRGRPTKARAARQLQGRYMGMLRAFSGRAKVAFKKLRGEKGTEAAIAAMAKENGDSAPKPRKAAKPKPKVAKAAKPAKAEAEVKPGTVRGKAATINLADAVAKAAKAKDAAKDTPAPQGA